MIVTKEALKEISTHRNSHSKAQVEMAQKLTGQSQWRKALTGMEVRDGWWIAFIESGAKTKKNKMTAKRAEVLQIINKMSTKQESHWRPQKQDIPLPKYTPRNKKKANKVSKKARVSRIHNKSFYDTKEWRAVRMRVIEKYDSKCMACGQSPKVHGIVIHVDHIKPRSKFPELSLYFDNLQLLCDVCNLGKGNKYQTDWRPHDTVEDIELQIVQQANERI